jgi:hypothetical protein
MSKPKERSLNNAWKALRMGNHISDNDLLAMEEQLKNALPYLGDRCPEFYLAFSATNRDLSTIQGYLLARGLIGR